MRVSWLSTAVQPIQGTSGITWLSLSEDAGAELASMTGSSLSSAIHRSSISMTALNWLRGKSRISSSPKSVRMIRYTSSFSIPVAFITSCTFEAIRLRCRSLIFLLGSGVWSPLLLLIVMTLLRWLVADAPSCVASPATT
ncbi:hypothetical protein BC350_08585 [Ralstonia pseudosolanacearum]|nr:hypothetical protein BC350_08585 [Ralstonia pseudosolanacearum]